MSFISLCLHIIVDHINIVINSLLERLLGLPKWFLVFVKQSSITTYKDVISWIWRVCILFLLSVCYLTKLQILFVYAKKLLSRFTFISFCSLLFCLYHQWLLPNQFADSSNFVTANHAPAQCPQYCLHHLAPRDNVNAW